jgi:diguanylate cyclase (GGDEF)-like protein
MKNFFVLTLTIYVLLLCSSTLIGAEKSKIQSTPGYFDLSKIDLKKTTKVALRGKWEFYWKQLLTPKDFTDNKLEEKKVYFPYPQDWRDFKYFGEELTQQGYATYRVKVKLPKKKRRYTLHVYELLSSYKMYVNGRKAISFGKVGVSLESSKPAGNTRYYSFVPKDTEIEIIIQATNFHHRNGGTYMPISIGYHHEMQKHQSLITAMDTFVIGCIIIMGLYHLCLFFYRRKNKAPLYFAISCLALGIRFSLSCDGDTMFHLFPEMPWQWTKRLEYMGFYIGIPSFAHFLYHLYPKESFKFLHIVQWIIAAIFCTMTVFSKAIFFTDIIEYYQISCLIVILFLTTSIILALKRKREGGFFVLIGILVLFATVVNDIMLAHNANTLPISQFGLNFFLFAQSVLLAMKFSKAFNQIEIDELKIRHMNKELIEKERARTLFFHNTSHELRTPLNGIIGFVDLFRAGSYGNLTLKMKTQLKKINDLATSLKNQVNTILDLAKSSKGELTLQNSLVNVQEVYESACTLAESLQYQGAAYEFSGSKTWENKSPEIIGDYDNINTIVRNLIGNAFKFKDKHRANIVTFKIDANEEALKIEIGDTGIGIPENDIGRIFKEFEQINKETNRSFEGTGLGLAMVKKLIDLMQGTIEVKSIVNEGTAFSIYIPAQSTVHVKREETEETEETEVEDSKTSQFDYSETEDVTQDEDEIIIDSTPKPYTILVVDDNEINVEVISELLISRGYPVETAHGGEAALNKIKDRMPDLMLLDLMMPDISGEDVLKTVRNDPDMCDLPIILITARASQEDKIVGLNMGADDYLSKPIVSDEILLRVKNILHRIDLAREKSQKKTMKRQNEIVNSLLELSGEMQLIDDIDPFLNEVLAKLNELFDNRSFGLIIEGIRAKVVTHMAFSGLSKEEKDNLLSVHHKISLPGAKEQDYPDSPKIDGSNAQEIAKILNSGDDDHDWILLGGNIQGADTETESTHRLKLFMKGEPLDDTSLNTIKVFIDQVIGASRNKLLTTELDRLAHTDILTGAYNRAFFEAAIETEKNHYKSSDKVNFSVLMCDINGLKEINDLYGHAGGDALIIKCYEILKEATRESDIIVRLGGDEFLVLSPGTTIKEAEVLHERILVIEERSVVDVVNEKTKEKTTRPARMAIGIASSSNTNVDDVLKEADRLMYINKENFYKDQKKYR